MDNERKSFEVFKWIANNADVTLHDNEVKVNTHIHHVSDFCNLIEEYLEEHKLSMEVSTSLHETTFTINHILDFYGWELDDIMLKENIRIIGGDLIKEKS